MHSGSSIIPENPAFSISIGISALIIEGRPLYDDEYTFDSADATQRHQNDHSFTSLAPKFYRSQPESPQSPLAKIFDLHSVKTSDRKPSSVSITDTPSGSSAFALKTDSTEHLERLRQKLHQLRSLPSTSCDFAEQRIAVSAIESPPPATTSSEPDLDQCELLDIIYSSSSSAASKEKPSKPLELQCLASRTTSLQRTPRSLNEHNGLLQTVTSWTTSKFSPVNFSTPLTASSSSSSSSEFMSTNSSSLLSLTTNFSNNHDAKKLEKRNGKVLGPHCAQFLSKIGLLKGPQTTEHSIEVDDHQCFKSSETCYRWQQCYKQIVPIFARCEPICIEVYLGPEHHVILLEQWIIQQNQEPGRFSMTIQSLCTAIRSQLHFSQITAWSDLLKSSWPIDPELKLNPRIKSSMKIPFKPKLDILYRIRPYTDTTSSCFSATPIVHNFPETIISDHLSIKVSLKSLPRIKTIPKLYDSMDILCRELVSESPTTPPLIADDRQEYECIEKGKHRCTFGDEESPTDDAMSHRNKQLLKYKKRLMRRERKIRNDELVNQKSSEFSSNSAEQSNAKHLKKQSMTHFSPLDQHTINPNKPPLYSSMSVDESEPVLNSCNTTSNSSNLETDNTVTTSYALNQKMQSNGMAQNGMTFTKSTQTTAIEMTSVGTQTDENHHYNTQSNQICNNQIIFHNCDFCGIEMQYFCWNCDKRMFMETADSQDGLEKADRLLKAIQRTPSVKQANSKSTNLARTNVNKTDIEIQNIENNNRSISNNNNNNNYNNNNNNNNNNNSNNSNSNNNNNNNNSNDTATAPITPLSSTLASNSSSNVISHSSMVCAVASDKDHCDRLNNKDEVDVNDCRSCCKRQKTVHNYDNDERNTKNIHNINATSQSNKKNLPIRSHLSDDYSVIPNVTSYDDASTYLLVKREHGECSGSYRRTMSESVVGKCHTTTENCTQPGIDLLQCDSMNIISNNELKLYRRAYSEDELICNCDDNRPKQLDLNTTNSPPSSNEFPPLNCEMIESTAKDHMEHFKTPIAKQLASSSFDNQTNPIYIECRSRDDEECSQESLTLNNSKLLPKINLTKLFTNDSSANDFNSINELDINAEMQNISQVSMPIFSFDFENLSPPLSSPTGNGFVQKSNSAPSFQYSPPTLSPRILKSAAATKRRSRHLSDRSSERLSIGSDDHLSDEEFHQYCLDQGSEYRPGISPTKATLRFFPKNYAYRKRALLGSFEESLLQRRFEPKFLVPGYKVLLGASGCYCTNQITIPAYTFFYELNDETLSTPYVCEVSMPPRKGYVIPRTGHVQATLLNPNGMVVRMFVVAYDFRDMPAMCQTFVRQRILSFDENANPGRNVDDLSAAEQMKLLRYAIHLKFQTTRSGRLALHGDIRMLISRRTDCDTAAAHAKGALESPSELKTVTIVPENPKFSPR